MWRFSTQGEYFRYPKFDMNNDSYADDFLTENAVEIIYSEQDTDSDFVVDAEDDFLMNPYSGNDHDGDGFGDFIFGTLPDSCPDFVSKFLERPIWLPRYGFRWTIRLFDDFANKKYSMVG